MTTTTPAERRAHTEGIAEIADFLLTPGAADRIRADRDAGHITPRSAEMLLRALEQGKGATKPLPTVAEDRHQASLQALTALLANRDDPYPLYEAERDGTIDPAFGHHVRSLLRLEVATSAHLRLSRNAAIMCLRFILDPILEEWGGVDPADGNIDESGLNILSDRLMAASELAGAIGADASSWFYTQETLQRQEEVRQEKAEKERQRQEAENAPPVVYVQPATIDRLRAMRAEFEDDQGIDFLISFADRLLPKGARSGYDPAAVSATPE